MAAPRPASVDQVDGERHGPDGEPDRELTRPSRDDVRGHAVDADRTQNQRGAGKDPQQHGIQPRRRDRLIEHVLHRLHAIHPEIRVNRSKLPLNRLVDVQGAPFGPDQEVPVA